MAGVPSPPAPFIGIDEVLLLRRPPSRYLSEVQLCACASSGAPAPSLTPSGGTEVLKHSSEWVGGVLEVDRGLCVWAGHTCHLLHCG